MNNDYRYQLENKKLTGKNQQKFTCPHCGRKKCFVRYVDTHKDFRYVADDVGKCDHQHTCGYHYKPSEYYRDHPWDRQQPVDTAARCNPVTLSPFQPIDIDYVRRSHSPKSIFWQWLSDTAARQLGIGGSRLQQLYDDYLLGATRSRMAIFWQIDHRGRVHGGHIMQYRPDGHRDGFQGWTHVPLIRWGLLPADWQLYQCLFGEHLLPRRPEACVCIVESEKTALVMAALRPNYLWLATAGSAGLSPERVQCLQGRRVTLFPDSGCYDKWLQQMQLTTAIDYNVSSRLEAYPPNTDLLDLLLSLTAAGHPPPP